jgi:hypothetical protein
VDLAALAETSNLDRLQAALAELEAENIYVPPLTIANLNRGHAIHFRCQHPEARNLRVDIMARMRGVAPFDALWERRKVLADPDGVVYELLALSDLIQAKKTQRDKDWPMIQRLLEADYAVEKGNADEQRREFWFMESRTPELLTELAQKWPDQCAQLAQKRRLLAGAASSEKSSLIEQLQKEEKLERERDKQYWAPLKRELEELRHARARNPGHSSSSPGA